MPKPLDAVAEPEVDHWDGPFDRELVLAHLEYVGWRLAQAVQIVERAWQSWDAQFEALPSDDSERWRWEGRPVVSPASRERRRRAFDGRPWTPLSQRPETDKFGRPTSPGWRERHNLQRDFHFSGLRDLRAGRAHL